MDAEFRTIWSRETLKVDMSETSKMVLGFPQMLGFCLRRPLAICVFAKRPQRNMVPENPDRIFHNFPISFFTSSQ